METWEEERNKRREVLEVLWQKFTEERGFRETYLICGRSIRLLRDALLAYENGAFLGCAVMCRGSTEAMIYAVASLDVNQIKKDPTNNVWAIGSRFDLVNMNYSCVLSIAKLTNLIRKGDEKFVNSIRERGNFAAHFGQKFDERILKYGGGNKTFTLDISVEDALSTLRATENFIATVMSRVFEVIESLPLPPEYRN